MQTKPKPTPRIPETPLKIFIQKPGANQGPFYVKGPDLANEGEMRDITEEEVSALAHIIFNAYMEWKKQ